MIDFKAIEDIGGMCVVGESLPEIENARDLARDWLHTIRGSDYVEMTVGEFGQYPLLHLTPSPSLKNIVRDHDTTKIVSRLNLLTHDSDRDLMLEIVLAAVSSPIAFIYPCVAELFAAARMRCNIVRSARRTELSFDPNGLERPDDCWTFNPLSGFILRPGASLIASLEKALFPDVSGRRYTFSCQRASEYLILLALALELKHSNPHLLSRIEAQWRTKALVADDFLQAFLFERGSVDRPFPFRCLIPGGRLWFKNPDDYSSDVQGYEGSWVCYLGDGKFVNFWDKASPYSLETKCVEIYHWRDAVYSDPGGKLNIDEEVVQQEMRKTFDDPVRLASVLQRMMKYRDPSGIYADGGCIDLTRDSLRWILPGTAAIEIQAQ